VFLRETGRKPTHLDRDLIASEGVHEDLPPEAVVDARMSHVRQP
jgi:hypothetical protein